MLHIVALDWIADVAVVDFVFDGWQVRHRMRRRRPWTGLLLLGLWLRLRTGSDFNIDKIGLVNGGFVIFGVFTILW